MYKRALSNIFSICMFYTVLLAITLIVTFSLSTSNNIQSSSKKEVNFIKGEFEKINTQNEIISNDVFANEYISKYVNYGDKYAKSKFQDDLSKYATLVAATIERIAVFQAGKNDFYCSDGAKTVNYYAETTGVSVDELFSFMEDVRKINTYKATDYFVLNNELTIVTYNGMLNDDVFLFVTFDIGNIFSMTESDDKNMFLFKGELCEYCRDDKLCTVAKKIESGEESFWYYGLVSEVLLAENSEPLKIICVVPKLKYANEYITSVLLAILISALILTIGVYVARKIAKSIYKPFKGLISLIDDMPDAIEDEFETIKKFIYDLKYENESIQKDMVKNENILENQFLSSVLLGENDVEHIPGYISNRDFKNKKLGVAILKYTDYDLLYSSLEEMQLYSFKDVTKKVLAEKFFGYEYFRTVNIIPEGHVLIYSVENGKNFETDITEVITIIDKKFSINMCAYLGEVADSIYEISKSYNDALYISKCTTYRGSHSMVCTKQKLLEIKNDNFVYPIEVESTLISAVLDGNLKLAKDNVGFLISMNEATEHQHDRFVQLVTMFSATISRIFSEIGIDIEKVMGKNASIYLELRQAENFTSLAVVIETILKQIIEYSSEASINEFKTIKESIEQYVENNYQKDISLADLANHLKLSETYVSKLFKNVMGKNFKEYVMYYKYKRAKEIMKEYPTYKLKDVAEMVGCNTTLTLSRLLKKYDNVSSDNE